MEQYVSSNIVDESIRFAEEDIKMSRFKFIGNVSKSLKDAPMRAKF